MRIGPIVRSFSALVLVTIVGLAGLASLAEAAPTCDPLANTCSATGKWTEPSLQKNGQPLTTLQKTTLKWSVEGVAQPNKDVPASAPSGGGTVTATVTVSVTACSKKTITGSITATNAIGESVPLPVPDLTMDRTAETPCVVPSSAANFTWQ